MMVLLLLLLQDMESYTRVVPLCTAEMVKGGRGYVSLASVVSVPAAVVVVLKCTGSSVQKRQG